MGGMVGDFPRANRQLTIWEFPLTNLSLVSDMTVQMPTSSRVIDVQLQHEKLYLWAMVDPDEPLRERRFKVFKTGMAFDESLAYRKTVHDGRFVWHVFEVI